MNRQKNINYLMKAAGQRNIIKEVIVYPDADGVKHRVDAWGVPLPSDAVVSDEALIIEVIDEATKDTLTNFFDGDQSDSESFLDNLTEHKRGLLLTIAEKLEGLNITNAKEIISVTTYKSSK